MTKAQQVYDEFWKSIIEPDGVVDFEQVKKELHDYHICIVEVSKVYCEISNSRISKPTTAAHWIIQEHQDRISEAVEDAVNSIGGDE